MNSMQHFKSLLGLNNMMLKSLSITLLLGMPFLVTAQVQIHQKLRNQIRQIAGNASGKIGVSVRLLETGDTLNYHNEDKYVMQSVFKLPIAMAVMQEIDQKRLKLDQTVHLTQADLPENYSPLRDKYPHGNVDVSIKELLTYMVTLSDNDACDILLKVLGGPQKVEAYVKRLGVKPIAIQVSEMDMHSSWTAQYKNWCWPSTQVDLLTKLYQQHALTKYSTELLWDLLLHTVVTPKRIKGLLPVGTMVGHRSGTSGTNDKGLSPGTNDVGIIVLPNGKHLAVAVFIMDSHDDHTARELLIAKIAKATYDEFTNQ
jgi:beta-lactamase class A